MIERERKYRLDEADNERLGKLLDRAGTLARYEIQETTQYVDGSGRLDRLNLRIRSIDGVRQELTVKGPRLESGSSKVRTEHTIVLSGDPAPFLAALGLVPKARYRKRTAIYAFEGAQVSLDDVEGLGRFCEIEGPDEVTIQRVADRLSLAEGSLEERGYARLTRARAKDGDGEV